ncbi:Rad9/Ddc1 [Phycomyces nitens]|nr:Rad9/Ddc1 [Phycomyces nitens]
MSLKAELPGAHLKDLLSCLDALGGFGDELRIEARQLQAVIRISPAMFHQYTLDLPMFAATMTQPKSINCGVEIKVMRSILRRDRNSTEPLDWCLLNLVDMTAYRNEITSEDPPDPCLKIDLVRLRDVTKTHSLWLLESEPLQFIYARSTRYSFLVNPTVLEDCLKNFLMRLPEIALECSREIVKVKSHWGDINQTLHPLERPTETRVDLELDNFIDYNIPDNVRIVFQAKEFRAVVTFAAELHVPLRARFDGPGSPLVLSAEREGSIIAEFGIMTFPPTAADLDGANSTRSSITSFNGHN